MSIRKQSVVKWLVAGGAVALIAGTAAAQNPNPTSISFGGNVQTSGADMLAKAQTLVSSASAAATTVSGQLQQARKDKDVVKTLCLNDVLSQIDTAQRTMTQRQTQLQSASGANDTELMNHEFTILSVLGQRVAQLQTQASNCIGTTDVSANESVIMSIDPGIAQSDVPPWATNPDLPLPPVEVLPPGALAPPVPCSPSK
jgi:hypothetical protein